MDSKFSLNDAKSLGLPENLIGSGLANFNGVGVVADPLIVEELRGLDVRCDLLDVLS